MSEPQSAPVSIPLSAQGYAAANEAFRQCWSGDRAEVLSMLAKHPPKPATDTLDVLGIGVGDGEFDLPLLATLRQLFGSMPISYVALEPNEAQLQGFRDRVAAEQPEAVSWTFEPIPAEAYQSDQRFDLIHYIHSLYHMPGSEEQLVLGSLAQLQPAGKLLIALAAERGGIYQMMGRFWNQIDYSFFTTGLFGQESLRALLDKHALPYDFVLFPDVGIDVTPCFDQESELGRNLLNFVLQVDMTRAPKALRDEALAALAEFAPERDGRRWLSHPSGVFILGAPAST